MFSNDELVEALQGKSVTLNAKIMLDDPKFQAMVDAIFNGPRRGKRTREMVEQNTLQGKMCELACFQLTGVPYEWNNFDVKNRKSYAVDLEAFNIRCEIKSVKPAHNVLYLPESAYKTLRNNIKTKNIDSLIACEYEVDGNEWTIRPKWIINPTTIGEYIEDSKYGFQYDVPTAIRFNDTISIQ